MILLKVVCIGLDVWQLKMEDDTLVCFKRQARVGKQKPFL